MAIGLSRLPAGDSGAGGEERACRGEGGGSDEDNGEGGAASGQP